MTSPENQSGTQTCDRCGDEYDSYTVFVRDNISDLTEHFTSEYDNLCKPCRARVTDYDAADSNIGREKHPNE